MSTAQLRNAVKQLAGRATLDLDALWRQVTTAVQAREALQDVLPAIVDKYGLAAGTVAAEWYDQQRAKAVVRGAFLAEPADLGPLGTDALAGFGVSPLFSAEPDWAAARTLVEGGVQRRIANAGRTTVMRASVADPSAKGWQRTGSGECAFCAMLIGRGKVYSEASADFASHDHCNCSAVPAFGGEPVPVKKYTPGPRHGNKADYDRARAYIATR